MSGTLSLNGTWGLTYAEGTPLIPARWLTGVELHGRRLMPAAVPAPIHQVLRDAGIIDEVNVGINSLKARWVEEQFWVYRHTFTAPAAAADAHAWLVFDRLELEATVWLNGQEIGRHANAHRPARFDITGAVQAGDNLLVVQLDTGIHSATDKSAAYCGEDMGKMTGRVWNRHAQCQSGWDWSARLGNVGILGDVRLEWSTVPRLDQVTVFAVPTPELTSAVLTVRATVENFHAEETEVTLRARIVETGQEIANTVKLAPGAQRLEVQCDLANPRLWWPIGQGEQFRYTVECTLEVDGETQRAVRKTGVRRVEMDQSPHPLAGRYCYLRINNRPVFCKGGNWVPADLLYSTVTPARYRELVDLAVGANFNMLRVWGGGLYTDHALCDACDEAGVMLWHDFLFACAKYPGDDPAFTREVNTEMTYAVRELAHHPSLVVWCGNNEIEWGDWEWGFGDNAPTHPHYAIFHHDIPRIVLREDPSTLHWISSPWSPDYQHPNDPIVGDQHPWNVSLGNAGGADFWLYRTYVDRFPNEGGVMGASSPATLRQFLPAAEQHPFSLCWDHHDNPFAAIDHAQGALGHAYETVRLWTGREPEEMTLDDYAYVSALLQAEGLREYITNYRRRMYSSGSAIFWMYNDCWPVTNGWTIVDYYRRKKLAYHPVRRANQPVTVVVAEEDGNITIYGVNDSPTAWSGQLHYGMFTLSGNKMEEECAVTLPANASTPLATFETAMLEKQGLTKAGAFAVLTEDGRHIAQHRLFLARFKELEFAQPRISMTVENGTLTLTSDAFAWGVCLDVDGELPLADNCIDLLPTIPYQMPWDEALGAPTIIKIGNRDAV